MDENENIVTNVDPISEGFLTALNNIHEDVDTSENYRRAMPVLTANSPITAIAGPILQYQAIMNEFVTHVVNKIIYTQFYTKNIRNPYKVLEGDTMPLGYVGEEIFINPAIGRDYDMDDFEGLLKKYEADVKVQYQQINFDKQYPVTIFRNKLKQAMTSWANLEKFISDFTISLYNGARIDEYNNTRALVTRAYHENAVQIMKMNTPVSKENAENFTEKVRELFLNFQTPSSDFNAWKKVGGYGRSIETLVDRPEDIVIMLRNDIQSKLDVQVIAKAFNIDSAKLMGNILPVKDFNIYDRRTGALEFDGSKILCIIADKSWFRIKTQDAYMDEFKNANNRSFNYYYNLTKMFSYSLFANAVVIAEEEPAVPITSLSYGTAEVVIENVGDIEGLDITVGPANGNSPTITYESESDNVFIVEADPNDNRHCILQATGVGTATLTAKAGNVQTTVKITVENDVQTA